MRLSGRLLGLEGEVRLGERIADLLDLSGLDHHRARARWSGTQSRRERGPLVVGLLVSLDPGRVDRLLAAGHFAGLWGRPWWIDPETGRRRSVPVRDPPTSFVVPRGSAPS